MPKHIVITRDAALLLDEYRRQHGGLSYSRAIGRLFGVDLPRQGERGRHHVDVVIGSGVVTVPTRPGVSGRQADGGAESTVSSSVSGRCDESPRPVPNPPSPRERTTGRGGDFND